MGTKRQILDKNLPLYFSVTWIRPQKRQYIPFWWFSLLSPMIYSKCSSYSQVTFWFTTNLLNDVVQEFQFKYDLLTKSQCRKTLEIYATFVFLLGSVQLLNTKLHEFDVCHHTYWCRISSATIIAVRYFVLSENIYLA